MKEINIYGTLNNATPDGVIAKAEQIKDSTQGKKQSEINADYKKRIETLESGEGTSSGGTTDYTDLINKPQINGHELSGNQSSEDLGLQQAGDYALKSEIPDTGNFATKEELNNITPTIGENGNWFINGEDTGKPAKGRDGANGVSLGEIALVQETGTESGSENKVMSQKAVSEKLTDLQGISWMQGGILANGVFNQMNSAYEVTDFIPVYPGLELNADVQKTNESLFNTGYDENQQYVSTLPNSGNITIPEGVYYVRINNYKSYKSRTISISKSALANKGDIRKLQAANEEIQSDIKRNTDNIFWINLKDLDIPLSVKLDSVLSTIDGTITSFPSCNVIEYIDIEQLQIIRLDGVCCGTNKEVALVCFYNSEKEFISSIKYSEKGKILNNVFVEKPSEAKYIQIGYNTNNIDGFTQVDILTSFRLYQSKVLFDKSILNFFTENNIMNFDLSKFFLDTGKANGFLDESGTTNYGNCYTTNYFEIKGQKLLYIKNAVCASNKATLLACFYNSEFETISGSGISYPEKNKIINAVIKVPSDAVYARFSYNVYNISDYTGGIEIFGNFDSSELGKIGKPYYGKRILSLGDSYTWLNYYGKYLAKATGCTQRGRGQNGNFLKSFANDTYSTSGAEGTTEEPFDYNLLSQYDIVTIMGGTNDYGHGSTTLGSLDTMEEDGKLGVNSKTIYGAVWYLINKILSIKPDMKIFFCTQPFRLPYESEATGPGGYEDNNNGLSMEKTANAIVEAAGYFGIPVFDFYHCSNWNPWTVRFTNPESPKAGDVVDNIYTYDGLHPKDGDGNGADLLGTAFGEFINCH